MEQTLITEHLTQNVEHKTWNLPARGGSAFGGKNKTITLAISIIAVFVTVFSVQAGVKKIKVSKIKVATQTIGEAQLKDNAVGSLRVIADDLITGAKIKDLTVTDADIASNANINAGKLNLTNAVTTDAIVNGTIKNEDIAGNASIDSSKLNLTGLPTPTSNQDAATKAYVDDQLSTDINNLKWKDPVEDFADLPTCNASTDGHARLVLSENWIYRCDRSDNSWHKVANVATVNHNSLQNRDAASAHPASAVTFSPQGNIAAETVQTAIAELDNEKLAANASFGGYVSGTYGAIAIGAGKVTNTMLAGSIAASKLIGTDITTVGIITAGVWNGAVIDDAHVADNITAANYLPLSGGTMTGDITLGTHNLTATTGDVTADDVTANTFKESCPTGYVWAPGLAKFGTLPGFCVMKYEAKCDDNADGAGDSTAEDATYKTWHNDTSPCVSASGRSVVSSAAGSPIAYISQETSRTYCQNLGENYHLISEPEWMTLAEQIANLPINDLDADSNPQLATGPSDNVPAYALKATAASDPVVTGCDLNQTMEAPANAYAASACEIRGDGSYSGDDNDKGFYGTNEAWSAAGYSAGGSNKSQLRTAVLKNKQVIWDLPSNVWEWTDQWIIAQEEPEDASPANEWLEYTNITKYKDLNYAKPPDDGWNVTNGTGRLYTNVGSGGTASRAFIRGGDWSYGSSCGLFALHLAIAPSGTGGYLGFRCALSR